MKKRISAKPDKKVLEKNKRNLMVSLLLIIIVFSFILFPEKVLSAPIHDHVAGLWTDNFTDTTGLSTSINMSTNNTHLMLTNSSDGFNPPYRNSGYIITTSIIPLSVAQWGKGRHHPPCY